MKRYTILMMVLLFIGVKASAQTTETKKTTVPVVNKGYYSIGNNNEKLATETTESIEKVNAEPAKKGFYAIKENNLKLPAEKVSVKTTGPVTVTKGYYSIGNNAQKLNKTRQ